MVQTVQLEKSIHAVAMLSGLKQLQQERQHCDFVVKVQGREVHAHKVVLSLGSPYFKAMLKHDTKEARDGKVEMRDVDSECVETCINFMYTARFDIPDGKVCELLRVAVIMQLDKVAISSILKKSLKRENFYETRNHPALHDLRVVVEECKEFYEHNFFLLSYEPGFKNERKSNIITMLETQELRHDQKLAVSINWMGEDKERKKDVIEMISMKVIDLEKVYGGYISDLLEGHHVISNDFGNELYNLLHARLMEDVKQSMAYIQSRSQGRSSNRKHKRSQDHSYNKRGSNITLKEALLILLRHRKPYDIPVDEAGYAPVNFILMHPQFQRFHPSERDIHYITTSDPKDRFETLGSAGDFQIRATHGHSFKLDLAESGLELITDPKQYPMIVHHTHRKYWKSIKKQGLMRMAPAHIHFAIGDIGGTRVTSGMRNTCLVEVVSVMRNACDVVIVIDIEKAIADGLKFYRAKNEVVLCEGDRNGVVSPKYFKMVKKYYRQVGRFENIGFVFEQ